MKPSPTAEAEPDRGGDAEPVTGLGIAGGAKRPGARSRLCRRGEDGSTHGPEAARQARDRARPPAKGLGIAAGARRPGAKKAPAKAAPNEGEATVTQPPNVDPDKAEPGTKTDTADSDLGVTD